MAMEEWAALLERKELPPDQRKEAHYRLAGLRAERDMAYHLKVDPPPPVPRPPPAR